MRIFTLERGLLVGALMVTAGLAMSVYSVHLWVSAGMRAVEPESMMRIAIPALTLLLGGMEVFFASFVLSVVTMDNQLPGDDPVNT